MHISVQKGRREVEVSVCFSCNFTTRRQVKKEKKEEKVWGIIGRLFANIRAQTFARVGLQSREVSVWEFIRSGRNI